MDQEILRRRSELSPSKLLLLEKRLKGKHKPASEPQVIPRRSNEGRIPLSFAQQRLWFLDQMETGNPFYNVPVAVRLKGALNVLALQQTLSEIVRRHESLRTNFVIVDGQPLQNIDVARPAHLPVLDLSDLAVAERDAEALRLTAAEMRKPFDLTCDPLLRTTLLRLGQDEHIVLLTMHHIVSDGWSVGVLIKEVGALYKAFSAGESSPLAELPIQYADYAAWQREWLTGDVLQGQLNYWKQQLAGAPPVLELPTDRTRPAVQSHQGAWVSLSLGTQLTEQLNALCQKEGVTLYMLLLAAFQTLLYRYSGQKDLVVGSPIAGRTQVETEGLIGYFVNTLVLRSNLSGNFTFKEFLQRVREVVLEAYANQDIPFEKLVEELAPERSHKYNPLVQVIFTLQNAPQGTLELPGLTFSQSGVAMRTTKFDLTLNAVESAVGINASWEYSTDLFDEATMQRMSSHFHRVLQAISADPDIQLQELPLLSPEESRHLLFDFNATQTDFPGGDKSLPQLFEEQVERTPEHIAVIFENQQLTYAQLNERANQLARVLRNMGVVNDSIVAICTQRSPEMVIAILATLKAGAAYVPLDPAYPQERLAYMLDDSRCLVLLTQERLVDILPAHPVQLICVDAEVETIAQESAENLGTSISGSNLAYVIYTSGSTGRPKGVMISHKGVVNYLSWCADAYAVQQGSGSPVHSPLGFDLTVTSLLAPLMVGQSVLLLDEEQGVESLVFAMRDRGECSLVKLTPAHLEILSHMATPEETAQWTRAFIIGGEALFEQNLTFWQRHAPATRLINEYGPTETVVGCCVYEVTGELRGQGVVPIGRPIANTQIYVLDEQKNPAPVGVAGELYIGGAGLARGYLNRPELTAEKFVPDPYSEQAGARLYRSGDLARRRADGELEYVGRLDDQVKVRGFRIELGEIANALRDHTGVRECEVLAVAGDGEIREKRIVAFVVAAEGVSEITAAKLRAELATKLPEYMLPSIVMMEAIPLTSNGKVDRKKLLEAEKEQSGAVVSYVAPRTPVEEIIAGIFAEVLGLERVGIFDNFFDLGGHSLLVTLVISRLREAFLVELQLRDVFDNPTVADLSLAIAQSIMEAESGTDFAELLGEVDLSDTTWQPHPEENLALVE